MSCPSDVDETEEDALTRERAWSVLSEEDEVAARDAFEQQRVAKIKKQRNDDRRARDVHAACRRLCAAFNGNSASRQWLECGAGAGSTFRRRFDAMGRALGGVLARRGRRRRCSQETLRPGRLLFSTDAPAVGAAARLRVAGAGRCLCARVCLSCSRRKTFLREGRKLEEGSRLALNNADVLGNGRRLVLRVFGSSANLFGAEAADLDMCVVPAASEEDTELSSPEVCRRVGEASESAGAKNVQVRDTARVPIVLFADPQTGLDCDVSTHNLLALRNTELLRAYAKIDGRARGMAYVIKKWAKIRGINSPSDGTLSSYGYILCVLAFLQTVPNLPILPSLQAVGSGLAEPEEPGPTAARRAAPLFDASRDVCLFAHTPTRRAHWLTCGKLLKETASPRRVARVIFPALRLGRGLPQPRGRAARTACVLRMANKVRA